MKIGYGLVIGFEYVEDDVVRDMVKHFKALKKKEIAEKLRELLTRHIVIILCL